MRAPSRGQMPGGATVAARACFTRRPSSPHVHRSRRMRTHSRPGSQCRKNHAIGHPLVSEQAELTMGVDGEQDDPLQRRSDLPNRNFIQALVGGPFEWLVPERAVIERLAENEETAVAAIAWMKFQGKPAARGRCAAAAVEKRCLLRSTALDRVRKLGQCHCVLEACRHLRDLERGARANAVVGRDLHRPNVFRVTSVASSAMPSSDLDDQRAYSSTMAADGSRIFLQRRPGRPVHRRPLKVRPPTRITVAPSSPTR
jgi:hypothetical protein